MHDVTARRGILIVPAVLGLRGACAKKEGFAVMYYGELGGRLEGCF